VSDALKAKSKTLSVEMKAISNTFDGKSVAPVADMLVLAEYVAWMKELPSQVCRV